MYVGQAQSREISYPLADTSHNVSRRRSREAPADPIAWNGALVAETAGGRDVRRFSQRKVGRGSEWLDLLPEEANSKQTAQPVDWSFTWEKHGFRAKDAPYRLEASVARR